MEQEISEIFLRRFATSERVEASYQSISLSFFSRRSEPIPVVDIGVASTTTKTVLTSEGYF